MLAEPHSFSLCDPTARKSANTDSSTYIHSIQPGGGSSTRHSGWAGADHTPSHTVHNSVCTFRIGASDTLHSLIAAGKLRQDEASYTKAAKFIPLQPAACLISGPQSTLSPFKQKRSHRFRAIRVGSCYGPRTEVPTRLQICCLSPLQVLEPCGEVYSF